MLPLSHSSSHYPSGKSYTFATRPREINLLNLNSLEINGRLKRYRPPSSFKSEERSNSHTKKLMPQPNSYRTLNPDLQTEDKNKNRLTHSLSVVKNKSSGLLSPQSQNSLLYYELPKEKKKTLTHSKTYSSFKFGEANNDNNAQKPLSKKSKYDIYNSTTQIYSLPGGIKREIPVRSRVNKLNEDSVKMKMNSDFSSKITCLPGSMTKDAGDDNRIRHKKSCGTQRFNAECHEERNFFRKGKKAPKVNYETIDRENTIREGKRRVPPGIRDQFRSQFTFC